MNIRTMTAAVLGLSMLVSAVPAFAKTTISSQMDIGSQNSDVRTVQQTLATESSFYPEGLTTGYFGQLTAAAVARFQAYFGLPVVGRVGPLTIAKFNSVISDNNTIDISAPVLSTPAVAPTNGGIAIAWSTNEPATGRVYYSASPLAVSDNTDPTLAPTVNGTNVLMTNTGVNTYNSALLTGLTANTTYYYMVEATDPSGNVSVTWPSTFTTSN